MTATIRTESVAIIAERILDRKMRAGRLDESDFRDDFKVPGTMTTYLRRTLHEAAKEAWLIIQAVEETRLEGR